MLDSSSAFYSKKDDQALHERFDSIESKIESMRKNNETSLRNQASLRLELNSLNVEIDKIYGLAEVNHKNLSESVQALTTLLGVELNRIKEFNQSFKETFQNNFLLELDKISLKISDLAEIYKTSANEDIERNAQYNQKLAEIDTLISQLIQINKNAAVDQATREEKLISNFESKLGAVNEKISSLIGIYKKSISAMSSSSKKNMGSLKKELARVNSKIKQLTEIYKTAIKENSATFNTISNNLSKQLQSIKNQLPKAARTK